MKSFNRYIREQKILDSSELITEGRIEIENYKKTISEFNALIKDLSNKYEKKSDLLVMMDYWYWNSSRCDYYRNYSRYKKEKPSRRSESSLWRICFE